MKHKHKKAQLLSELERLRRRVAELEEGERNGTSSRAPGIDTTKGTRTKDAILGGEEGFRRLTEAADSAIFIFQDSLFRYANPATSRLTGYTREELLGTNIWNLVHPEFRELIRERVLAWQRGEAVPSRSEFKILTKSGETRWINADSNFIEFDGKPAALTIGFDSTGHKRAEEALSESEQRYRELIETTQEAIWVVDAEANTTYVNQQLAEMFGYTRGELLGRSVFDFVDDADRMEGGRYLERGRSGIKERHDFRFRRKDGSEVWTMVSTTPLFDAAGQFIGGLAMLVDITERRRSEEALRKSEERWRVYIEQANDLIFTLDRSGRMTSVNNAACRTTGFTVEELLGKSPLEFVVPEQRAVAESALRSNIAGESIERIELDILSKDGRRVSLEVRGRILYDDGQIIGAFEIAREITERKATERALKESEARLQAVIENLPLDFWARDVYGRCIIENPYSVLQWGHMLGRVPEETAPDRETLALWEKVNSRALAGEVVKGEIEITHGHHAGYYYYVAAPIRVDGEVHGILGVSIDITDRKRAEEGLRRSEANFRVLAETAALAILIYQDSKIVYLNPFAVAITGYSEQEQLSMDFWEIIHPDHRDMVRERGLARLRGEAVPARYDLKILTKSGEVRWLDFSANVIEFQGMPSVLGAALDVTDRKRAEEALRESEAKFRALAETAAAAIFIYQDSNLVYVNPMTKMHTGYDCEDLLRMPFWEIIHPDFRDIVRERGLARQRGERVPERYEFKIITRSGETRWLDATAVSIEYEGKPAVLGTAFDITEHKRTEQALRKSQAQMQAILDNCPAMIFQKDLDGRYLQINRQFERTFNLAPEQVLGRTDGELFPPDVAAAFRATDRSVLEAGRSLEFEESAIYDDGPHGYIVHKFPLEDSAGNVYAVGGISTDISGRKRAEDELRKQKEILQTIFDHVPVMISFVGEDGRMKLVNQVWERKLGWSLEEIEKQHLDIFVECYPDPQYRQKVLRFVAESSGEWADFTPRVRDGRVIDATWARVRLSDGTSIGIAQDITERKRVEEMLRRQAAQLAALHEIELEISAERDLTKVLDVVTRRAAQLLNAYHCSTYILNREESLLRLVASTETGLTGSKLRLGEGVAGRVAETGKALAIENYGIWQGRASIFEAEEFGPALGAPLKWQQTVIGAISLGRRQGQDPFTSEDSHFLEQLAAEAAIAIHQATLFEELQDAHKRLQVLSHRLIDAQEAERQRLARELHDQIGQSLTAAQLSLQAMQPSVDAAFAGRVEDSLAIIDEALQQVHDLSLDLRPSLLDDLGLVAALRWYVDRLARTAGLLTSFNADILEPRLPPEIETACFRIAQEALTNVLRHANARTVWVELTHLDSGFQLAVRDDGIGFDVRAVMSRTGANASLGLQGMQERALAIGSGVYINSKPGAGTEIRVNVPLVETSHS
jgi:PAS domain S-box-containing protein